MLPLPCINDFAQILHICRKERDHVQGLLLHAYLCRYGFELHRSLSNYLVPMLVEVGSMLLAQHVFDRLLCRNVWSWNALITGYVKHGRPRYALSLYNKMQKVDLLQPIAHTFVALLKACTMLKDLKTGSDIHDMVEQSGLLERDVFIGSTLIEFYARCGSLLKAHEVFDRLLVRDVVVWNTLIAGYVENGQGKEAMRIFEQMQADDVNVSPDGVTFVFCLKACSSMGADASEKAADLHSQIDENGLLKSDIIVGTALVGLYAKCSLLVKAKEVFDDLPARDVIAWNALITGYTDHEHAQEALECFDQMLHESIIPNSVSYVYSLKACGNTRAIDKGKDIHMELERNGLLEKDLVVGNTLVDMYAKCGLLGLAIQVFEKLQVRDVVTWTALIAGYTDGGDGGEALKCLEQMNIEGVFPDAVTFVYSLKACSCIGAIDKGREIHIKVEWEGLLGYDLVVGTTLVDMYARCGLLVKAWEVFDKLLVRDVVSWNSLITGYLEHGHGEEALHFFEQMQLLGVVPNAVTFICSLKACGSIGALDKGLQLHAEIERKGLLEENLLVGNTLVDMYAKCGFLAMAQQVFDMLPAHDVVLWNALITGYAECGETESVFGIFDRLLDEGVKPDPVTFLVLLTACSRTGIFDKSENYFEAMSKEFGIVPAIEHHAGMVDLLSRTGESDKALAFVRRMPFCPNLVVWHSLLGACSSSGDVELGRRAFKEAVRLDKTGASAYLLMSQIRAHVEV